MNTLLLHPSTCCHDMSLRGPAWVVWTTGCRGDTRMGQACSHKPSAPGKAGLKPARNLGRWYGGVTRQSYFTSARKLFQSASGFQAWPPVPLLTLPNHRLSYLVLLPNPEEGGWPRAGCTSCAKASRVHKSVGDAGSTPQRMVGESARQVVALT